MEILLNLLKPEVNSNSVSFQPSYIFLVPSTIVTTRHELV